MTIKKGSKAVKSEVKLKRLYFDCEVSPNIVYSWNVGYDLNIGYENILQERAIICISYKWEGSDKTHTLVWKEGSDKDLVKQFVSIINSADEVVGHNGDRFDLKWFRTRCLYHGIKSLPEFKSIDTLKIARNKFKFNSNRLDYIAKFLGLGSKIKTDFNLWVQVMAGDTKALKYMTTYCEMDVVILEKVYKKLEGYSPHKTHVGVLLGGDKCDCPKCGSKHTVSDGNSYSASGLQKKRMQCKDCSGYFTVSLTAYEGRNT
jgi:hypothetical protein